MKLKLQALFFFCYRKQGKILIMAEKLPNPFESKKGTEDYIGFSASSTPREDKFQPRRGKQNRQDNWRRFGAFEQQRQQRGGGGGGMLPVQGGYSPQTSSNF